MSLLGLADNGDFTVSHEPLPYGSSPGLTSDAGKRDYADHTRRTWKAYHERQALIAVERQYGRPVQVDSTLWGDLLGGKLEELIEGERNHPRSVVKGGAADRDGRRCLLPELDDARFQSGHDRAVAAAVGKPRLLRFSDEGSEYTADSFGAGGGFSEMYQRRYDGFNARVKEAGGLAAERAWSRAGRPSGKDGESHRERRSKEKTEHDAKSIPWSLGTARAVGSGESGSGGGGCERAGSGGGVGGVVNSSFGGDLFAGDTDSALSAPENGGEKREGPGKDLGAHPSAQIGPDTHSLNPEEVELLHKVRDEEKADGSNASLATQMEHRLVPMGAGTGAARTLRGTAARQRQEQTRTVAKDPYLEGAVRRNRHAASSFTDGDRGDDNDDDDDDGDDDDDDDKTVCSVTTFEDYYVMATQAADALPAIESMLNDEERPGSKKSASSEARPPRTAGAAVPAAAAAAAAPTAEAVERERRREEHRVERSAKMGEKRARQRTNRFSTTLGSGGGDHGAPVETLTRRYPGGGGGGGGGGNGFRNASDEASLAPSMSSLGSFDERSGNAPRLLPADSVAEETGASASLLPASLLLPPAVGHTLGDAEKLPSVRRRSTRTHTTPPSPPTDADRTSRSTTTGALESQAVAEAPRKEVRKHRSEQVLLPPAGRRGVAMMDDETNLECSATGFRPAAEAGAGAVSVFSTSGAGTAAGGSAASIVAGLPETGPAGTDWKAAVLPAGDDGDGAEDSAAARRRGPDRVEQTTTRKKQRGGGGDGGRAQRVHKINLGSKRNQMSMTPAERTALLIGACEWGDLEALQRLLELGASPLDPYSSSLGQSRCVFCQFFVFVLQVGAGLRPRLALDDSLHDRALSLLIEAGLEDNPQFLLNPRLRDRDENRGFCLLHHAAAFGNVSKVEFLLRKGVEPDVRAEGGDETALMVAARRGQRLHLRVAAALVQAGAAMLARDREGMTALHHAADVGRKHMCHYLLLVGADKTAQDCEGRTPMDLCRTKHPRAFVALRSFVRCRPPPATILDYMEKVEVQGLKDSAAQEKMLLEQAERERHQQTSPTAAAATAAAAAASAAADVVIGGGDEASLASWDSASLAGVSGAGASVLSLGSLAPAATIRYGSR